MVLNPEIFDYDIPQSLRDLYARSLAEDPSGVGIGGVPGIPGTGMIGLPVAAAMGAVCGDSSLGLEVLRDVTPGAVGRAKELLDARAVRITVSPSFMPFASSSLMIPCSFMNRWKKRKPFSDSRFV